MKQPSVALRAAVGLCLLAWPAAGSRQASERQRQKQPSFLEENALFWRLQDPETLLAERDDLRAQLATKNGEFLAQHRRADLLVLRVRSLEGQLQDKDRQEEVLESKLDKVREILLSDDGVELRGNTSAEIQGVASYANQSSATRLAAPFKPLTTRRPGMVVGPTTISANDPEFADNALPEGTPAVPEGPVVVPSAASAAPQEPAVRLVRAAAREEPPAPRLEPRPEPPRQEPLPARTEQPAVPARVEAPAAREEPPAAPAAPQASLVSESRVERAGSAQQGGEREGSASFNDLEKELLEEDSRFDALDRELEDDEGHGAGKPKAAVRAVTTAPPRRTASLMQEGAQSDMDDE